MKFLHFWKDSLTPLTVAKILVRNASVVKEALSLALSFLYCTDNFLGSCNVWWMFLIMKWKNNEQTKKSSVFLRGRQAVIKQINFMLQSDKNKTQNRLRMDLKLRKESSKRSYRGDNLGADTWGKWGHEKVSHETSLTCLRVVPCL